MLLSAAYFISRSLTTISDCCDNIFADSFWEYPKKRLCLHEATGAQYEPIERMGFKLPGAV